MSNKFVIENILPHKKPMILIDDILDYSLEGKWIKTIVTINENNMFYDNEIQGVPAIVGLEYMAQTTGCYVFFRSKAKTPKIGFLLGTRLYNNSLEKFSLNESYIMEAKEVFLDENDNLASFDCCIYNIKDEKVASATVNAYQSENAKEEFKNE